MTANQSNQYAGQRIVLFDGVCKLCNAWVRFLIKYDTAQRIKLCSVQSERGQSILQSLGMPTDRYETMVFLEDSRVWKQGDAFLKVVGHFPMPWPLLRVLLIVPRPLRNWLYERIALNRYRWFGRNDRCLVPNDSDKARFLDNGW